MDEWKRVLRGGREAAVLILAAHPDDETVGAGAALTRLRRPAVVHLTDGAPRDRRFISGRFQGSVEEYAEQRRDELRCALAGIDADVRCLGARDQEAAQAMRELAVQFAAIVGELRPEIVITHPYEGGHPDHDACAFVAAQSRDRFTLVEMASYNAFGHEFLPAPEVARPAEAGRGTSSEILVIELTREERERKRTMLSCFTTQVDVLAHFAVDVERFRVAPSYDFTRPPHDGRLNYEIWEWPMTGAEWRRLAAAARA